MAKCRNCANTVPCVDLEGNEFEWCPEINDNPDLDMDRTCDKYIAMTNADRIRTMDDEELRDLFSGIDHFWDNTPTVVIEGKRMEDNPTDILEWLQSEVE